MPPLSDVDEEWRAGVLTRVNQLALIEFQWQQNHMYNLDFEHDAEARSLLHVHSLILSTFAALDKLLEEYGGSNNGAGAGGAVANNP